MKTTECRCEDNTVRTGPRNVLQQTCKNAKVCAVHKLSGEFTIGAVEKGEDVAAYTLTDISTTGEISVLLILFNITFGFSFL